MLMITVSQGDRAINAKPIMAISDPVLVTLMLQAMTDYLADQVDPLPVPIPRLLRVEGKE